MFDIWAKHDDCYFQVYTNGTLITDEVADRLVELGNVAPMISIEGTPEETDFRRGPGMYDKIIETYRRLRKKECCMALAPPALVQVLPIYPAMNL